MSVDEWELLRSVLTRICQFWMFNFNFLCCTSATIGHDKNNFDQKVGQNDFHENFEIFGTLLESEHSR